MKFSVEWLGVGRNAAAYQAATVCHLKLSLGGVLATEHRPQGAKMIRDSVTLPAVVVAEGIANRWWTLLEGRGRTTRMRSFRDGFALPDVSFVADGRTVHIQVKPYVYDNPGITFFNSGEERIPHSAFESELSAFVRQVVKRLLEKDIRGAPLQEQWDRIAASQMDPEELQFCRAAGALGIDPYSGDENANSLIFRASEVFEGDALLEFLAGTSPQLGHEALDWFAEARMKLNGGASLPGLADFQFASRNLPAHPWELGYSVARKAREKLGLQRNDKFSSVKSLAAVLGNKQFKPADGASPALRAVASNADGTPQVVVGERAESTTLFALARGVGEIACFDVAAPAPITQQEGSYRQAVNRAFAAEFLAPATAVMELRREGWAPDDIAPEFGVSPEVIKLQMQNQPNA